MLRHTQRAASSLKPQGRNTKALSPFLNPLSSIHPFTPSPSHSITHSLTHCCCEAGLGGIAERDAWKGSCRRRKERRDILEGGFGALGWVIYETLKEWEGLKRVQLQICSLSGTCRRIYTPFPQFPLGEHLECLIKWHLRPQWPDITPNYSDVVREFPCQLTLTLANILAGFSQSYEQTFFKCH